MFVADEDAPEELPCVDDEPELIPEVTDAEVDPEAGAVELASFVGEDEAEDGFDSVD